MSEKVVDVEIDKIKIPDIRVHSYFEKPEHDALKESMKEYGQRVPILLYDVDGELWLSDGYHRLEVAKELGWKTVKAIIRKGDKTMVDIDNLITAAIRGRNNPALFAKVVKKLKDEHGLSWKEISKKVGYSPVEVKKYYDLNELPQEVLDMVASGKLSISKALLLLQLPDPRAQVQAAEDIVKYGYNEAAAKEMIKYYLEAFSEAPVQPSRPVLVKPDWESTIHCEICDNPMLEKHTYHWICDECWEAIRNAIEAGKSESESKPKTS
ncbi:MAG: ParB/RepB/Spo0J family partition protein [Candidatus Bathyarchaeia archaeon]